MYKMIKIMQQNIELMLHINQQQINQQASQFIDKEMIMRDSKGKQ